MPLADEIVAPPINPAGNGLVNNPTIAAQPALPPPTPIPPVAGYTAATATPQTATSTGYTPTPYVVPEKGLVQQQIKDIIGEDSPLMQQARVRAMQTMNERGLANSSLNTEAGQNAVIAQAMPIAASDAAAHNAAMTNTANAQNTASQFGANAANTTSAANAQLVSTMNLNNALAKNTALSAEAQAANVRALSQIDNNSKQALAVLDTQNRQLLQTNANAANMFQETVKNIAGISVNDSLTKAAKDAAIATQINLLNEGLKATANIAGTVPASVQDLNLSQFFQPNIAAGTTPAQQQATLTAALDEAKASAPKWSQPANTGWRAQFNDGKPNGSERAAAWFASHNEAAQARIRAAQQALDAWKASQPAQAPA